MSEQTENPKDLQDLMDQSYEDGVRAGLLRILNETVRQLGYSEETKMAFWIEEREAIKNKLKEVCAEFGKTNWPDDMYLPDVIENYLFKPLTDKT